MRTTKKQPFFFLPKFPVFNYTFSEIENYLNLFYFVSFHYKIKSKIKSEVSKNLQEEIHKNLKFQLIQKINHESVNFLSIYGEHPITPRIMQ